MVARPATPPPPRRPPPPPPPCIDPALEFGNIFGGEDVDRAANWESERSFSLCQRLSANLASVSTQGGGEKYELLIHITDMRTAKHIKRRHFYGESQSHTGP